MEADRESVVALVGEDVGGGLEDRLQELAGLVVVPREEGLDEASKRALRAVGGELDGIDEDLALALELHDLLGLEHGVEGDVLGQCGDGGGELLDLGLALLDELVEFLFVEHLLAHARLLAGREFQAASRGASRERPAPP